MVTTRGDVVVMTISAPGKIVGLVSSSGHVLIGIDAGKTLTTESCCIAIGPVMPMGDLGFALQVDGVGPFHTTMTHDEYLVVSAVLRRALGVTS